MRKHLEFIIYLSIFGIVLGIGLAAARWSLRSGQARYNAAAIEEAKYVYTIEYTNAQGETREYSAHTLSSTRNKIVFIDASNNDEVTIPGNYIVTKYKWDLK
tara:strand:- start:137 stop:442 length:306 start_codon:yes stop_codon:yes gene_type:complete